MADKSIISSHSFEDHKGWAYPLEQTPNDSPEPHYEMRQLGQDCDHPQAKASWHSLFAFTAREDAGSLATAIAASIFAGLIRPTSAIIFGQLFNTLTNYGAGSYDEKEMLHRITTWCLALAALGAATWFLEWPFLSLWLLFGEIQAKSIRQKIFTRILDKNVEWYDLRRDGIGSLSIRIETQIRELQLSISQPLGFFFLEITATIASIGTALFCSWKLTLVIFATFPIAAAMFALISRPIGSAIERQKRELSRSSTYANSAVTAINTVKAFNGEDQEVWQYFLTTKAITRYYLIQARANALQSGVIKFFAVGLFVTGFWYGLYLATHGLTVGHVITTFVSCAYAMQAVEIILPQFLVLAKGTSAGETLKSVLAETQEGRSTHDEDGDLTPHGCPGDIEINDISFAYPLNPNQNVLQNATFFFPAGEITFIIGKSGSGKSTIGNLLMKFYGAQSGEILVDGHPIQTLKTEWVRQNITLVQQQAVLFNDTILQNIVSGTRQHMTKQQARRAARDAGLEQAIDEMPLGFDTLVGPKHRALSGGQSQRVAIARARLRDTPILILDESTSALDQTSRIEVIDKLRAWRKGKTTVIITHDVSQVLGDDYVYVLKNTKVVEEGYCKTLAAKSLGDFAQFVKVAKASSQEQQDLFDSFFSADHIETIDSHPHKEELCRASTLVSTHDKSSTKNGKSLEPPRNGLSTGQAMIAQTNALLADARWSNPIIIPDLPVKSRRSSRVFMPFVSPVASPQAPSSVFQSSIHIDRAEGTPNMVGKFNVIQKPSQVIGRESRKSFLKSKSKGDDREDIEHKDILYEHPASLSTIFRSVWPALTWRDRILLLLGLTASVIVGASTPVFSWLFSQLLQTFYSAEDRTELAQKWALCMLGVAVIDGSSCYCSHYFLEKSGQAWINFLRVESLRRILAQPKSWFDMEQNAPKRLTECLDRNAEEMRNLIGRFVGLAITISTMLSITVLWAFAVEWKLTLVALASAPAMYAVTRLYHWSSAKWEGKSDQGCEIISSIFTETVSNIRVIRALTLENHFARKHDEAISNGYKIGKTRAAVSGCMFGIVDSMIYYVASLVFYYGSVIISSGDATVTDIFVVINLLLLGISNALGMFAMIPQLNSSRTTATQVLRLVNLPLSQSHESQGTRRLNTPFPIILNKLNFTYQSRPHTKTLDNISLTINPGSCTAIVGSSGSGKSTIASLLLGLYPPDPSPDLHSSSALTFAGNSILECNIHNIRSYLAIVPQTPLLFPNTIFSNIAYALPETSPFNNHTAVRHAAIDAGIHDFISSLENGYNTPIGEGGMGLSGGQAQRIAIARALVRRPKVLILDEATSALDAESASGIRDTVQRLKRKTGLAVVIISHNVDMMRISDTIVVVEDGRVVESGGFDELRARGGAFETLIGGQVRLPARVAKADGDGGRGGSRLQ